MALCFKSQSVGFSLLFFLILNCVSVSPLSSEGCPVMCLCKWRGGKQTVSCRHHGLVALPEGIDPETQVLDISGNRLDFVEKEAFLKAGLLNLQKIHASNSKITNIEGSAFAELQNLVELDLSDNLLSKVPTEAFRETPNIRDLILRGNPIKTLENGAFRYLTELVKLDLSRCQISLISDQAFSQLKLLEILRINSNLLSVITNATTNSLSGLNSIEVHDNPWECSCQLRDFKIWLETKNVPYPVSPVCQGPQRLTGKKFSDLPLPEFSCPPRILESFVQTHLSVFEGDNATLDCYFSSIPKPSVRWYLFGRPISNNTLLSPTRKFVIFEQNQKSSLTLTSANIKDGGDFFCVVENSAGFAEGNFSLEILPQPPFLPVIMDETHLFLAVLSVALVICFITTGIGIFLCVRFRCSRRSENKRPCMGSRPSPGSGKSPVPHSGGGDERGLEEKGWKPDGGDLITTDNHNPDLIQTNTSPLTGPLHSNQCVQELSTCVNFTEEDEGDKSLMDRLPNQDFTFGKFPGNGNGNLTKFYPLGTYSTNTNYSNSSTMNNLNVNNPINFPLPLSISMPMQMQMPMSYSNHGNGHSHSHSNHSHIPNGVSGGGNSLMYGRERYATLAGIGKYNGVGARIMVPNARDSPDEGYQEGYVGTDV